jgi:hypothetical protein
MPLGSPASSPHPLTLPPDDPPASLVGADEPPLPPLLFEPPFPPEPLLTLPPEPVLFDPLDPLEPPEPLPPPDPVAPLDVSEVPLEPLSTEEPALALTSPPLPDPPPLMFDIIEAGISSPSAQPADNSAQLVGNRHAMPRKRNKK